MTAAAARAAAGVAWLDQTRPDWYLVIDREGVAMLDMGSTNLDVLGMIWGEYDAAPGDRSFCSDHCDRRHLDDEWAIRHGFCPACDGDEFELNQLWREVITARLDAYDAAGDAESRRQLGIDRPIGQLA